MEEKVSRTENNNFMIVITYSLHEYYNIEITILLKLKIIKSS